MIFNQMPEQLCYSIVWHSLCIRTGEYDGSHADADQALHGKPRAEAPVTHSPALVDVS